MTSGLGPVGAGRVPAAALLARHRVPSLVHGTAVEVTGTGDRSRGYESLVRDLYAAEYGPAWIDWYEQQKSAAPDGDGFTGFIEPRVFFAKH